MRRPVSLALRLKERTSTSPSIGVAKTRLELDAINELYEFVFRPSINLYANGDGGLEYSAQLQLYKAKLDKLLHSLLHAFMFRPLNPTRFMGCMMNVSLALSCFNPDSTFKLGSLCTQRCAAYQYYIRSTAVHTLRLHANDQKEYVAPSDGHLIQGDEEEVEDFEMLEKINRYISLPAPSFFLPSLNQIQQI